MEFLDGSYFNLMSDTHMVVLLLDMIFKAEPLNLEFNNFNFAKTNEQRGLLLFRSSYQHLLLVFRASVYLSVLTDAIDSNLIHLKVVWLRLLRDTSLVPIQGFCLLCFLESFCIVRKRFKPE